MTPRMIDDPEVEDSFEMVENTKKSLCAKKKASIEHWMRHRTLAERVTSNLEIVFLVSVILYITMFTIALRSNIERLETEQKKSSALITKLQKEVTSLKRDKRGGGEEYEARFNLRDFVEPHINFDRQDTPPTRNRDSDDDVKETATRPNTEFASFLVLFIIVMGGLMFRAEMRLYRKKRDADQQHQQSAQKAQK